MDLKNIFQGIGTAIVGATIASSLTFYLSREEEIEPLFNPFAKKPRI